MLRKLSKNKILISILILASLLRFIGTNPGYNRYHNDEPIIYGTAIEMVENKSLDPKRFDYPGGPIYINYIFFKSLFIPAQWFFYYATHVMQIFDGTVHIPISDLESDRLFHTYILGGKDFYPLFWGRYVVALFSVGNVVLIYILAKKLFGKNVGLISAFLLAINFRQILNSHIDLPDIYNAFFLLAASVSAVRLWQKPSKINYLIAGIAAGLSFSMKYEVFSLLPIFIAHLYVSIDSGNFVKALFNWKAFLIPFASILTFMIFNPYFFIHFETAKFWLAVVSQRYGLGVNSLTFYPLSYLYHYDYGAPEFILSIIGSIWAIWKYPKKIIFILPMIIVFMALFLYLSRGGFYVRNFVSVTPLLLIFPAIALAEIYRFLRNKTSRRLFSVIAFLGILSLVAFVPLRNSIINTYYYTKPWNYEVLSNWLYKNFPDNQVVAANPFDPPTGSPPMNKTEFALGGSYSLAEHRDDGASYALSNSDWIANSFFFWMSYGIRDLTRFWNKPIDILRNTFYGLGVEELLRYQIFSISKPWQAPDEALVLAKIPVWPNVQFNSLLSFNFDKSLEGWKVVLKENNSKADYVFDQNRGHRDRGSICYLPLGSKYSIVRITSKPIDIQAGFLYKVTGFIKSDEILAAKSRNGFIRVDFYNTLDFTSVGMISSVSSRLYGSTDWTQKEVIERAPDGAKYMTISFQMSDDTISKICLDDVNVDISKGPVEDITAKFPYTRKKIDMDLLYTNSHANL